MPADVRPVTRALISVSDKAGLIPFATALVKTGVQLVSTGGTAKALAEAGLAVVDVAELTGYPEMMDGRVKTLHPRVHGGILAIRTDPGHQASMAEHGIPPIDLVVVNLYPFEATVARGADFDETIENIDIGGPALIRGAAKNHNDVAVVVDVSDYSAVLAEIELHGGTTLALRRKLAQTAYARTAAYDAAISNWFAVQVKAEAPSYRAVGGKLIEALRYGENPHQTAAFYATSEQRAGVATARQVQGKQLSFNNINDTDAAFECVAEFHPARTAAVVIVKHANPCGVAEGSSLAQAYAKALACDPVSAFGGIIAVNRTLDAEAARAMVEIFTEVIVAPDATEEAINLIAAKKDLRLLLTGGLPDPRSPGLNVRTVAGGLLVQSRDNASIDDPNTIIYAKDLATVGIGAGQMSRVDSARIAARKAQDAAEAAGLTVPLTKGSVVASDAFFPFADGLLAAVEAGATAVIQPGGSMRDAEVIAAADAAGLAMVFTGVRHFKH
ncbi:MAG: bifunctional phosphoribosylaminoimidazolecarboxamide formyltransferase/IMP cyclohydrolase [Rhizobiales bacterium 12-66-7]|nr:MAG: bifunctional phosphoribosylaminoimidazolecarboxamide formyltransferase/IMP cyclohydrolase [Rhizobiales bacterium 12-66-7]